uniref:Uncharacterized protein n=1 Tax=Salix viminalis TaxID=40686 RepID=A0A6N2M8T7_SALVM
MKKISSSVRISSALQIISHQTIRIYSTALIATRKTFHAPNHRRKKTLSKPKSFDRFILSVLHCLTSNQSWILGKITSVQMK